MPDMRIATAIIAVACLHGADSMGTTPLLVQAGGTYLNSDLRAVSRVDWGYSAGIATLLAESGAIGVPTADIGLRTFSASAAEMTSIEICYAERALVGDRYWLGAGIGSNWTRLRISPVAGSAERSTERWAIGGKAMLGYLLTDRLFVESTYHYSGEALGIDTSTVSLALGYWF